MGNLDEKQLPSEKETMYRANGTLMRCADALESIVRELDSIGTKLDKIMK